MEMNKQTPPKPGMESFKGNPVAVRMVKANVQDGASKRQPVTKND